MPVNKPHSATYHQKRQTSTLHFTIDGKESSEEFIMRGGICWPMSIREGGRERIEGYALVLGKNISSGAVTIFEETKFVAIDHITDSEGRIKYHGVSPWFNKAWTSYWCQKFYWRDRSETHEHYMRQILRSTMIKPNPRMPEVVWDEESEVTSIIGSLAMQGKLIADKNMGFMTQQRAHLTNPDQPSPARHAMICAMAGLDQYRWMRGKQDYD